jgi:hypothetical protein
MITTVARAVRVATPRAPTVARVITTVVRDGTARARTAKVRRCLPPSEPTFQQTSVPWRVPPETKTNPVGKRSQTETPRTRVRDWLVTRIANETVDPDWTWVGLARFVILSGAARIRRTAVPMVVAGRRIRAGGRDRRGVGHHAWFPG